MVTTTEKKTDGNAKRRQATKASPKTGRPAGRPFKLMVDLMSVDPENPPRVVITGTGTLANRPMRALRISQDVMDRLSALVQGPAYLAASIAISGYCDMLEEQKGTAWIKAEDVP